MSADIFDLMRDTLATVAKLSGGELIHNGRRYRIYKTFAPDDARTMLEAGYDPETVNLVVMIPADQLLAPYPVLGDVVELDGVEYSVRGPITKSDVYWVCGLRETK